MALELLLSALSSLGFLLGGLLYFKSKIEVDSFFNKFNFKLNHYSFFVAFFLGFGLMHFLLKNAFGLVLVLFGTVLITGSFSKSYKKSSFMSLLFLAGVLIRYLF